MQDTEKMEKTGIRESLGFLLQELGLSQRLAAEQIGVSLGALSAWLSGSYKGSNEVIESKVGQFISRNEERRQLAVVEDEFFKVSAKTSVYVEVQRALRHCHLKGKIGVVTSDSGNGKTRAVRDYADKNSGVIVVECHHSFPARSVLAAIAKAAGVEAKGNIHDVLTAVCDKLRGTGRLIVLDEAEHLRPNVLDIVRRINDWAQIGIVYVGLPRFSVLLKTLRGDYEYIWNRVRVRLELDRSGRQKAEDVRLILESVHPGLVGVYETFYGICGGDIRKVEALYFASLTVAKKRQEQISESLVLGVSKQIGMEG